MSLWSLFIHLSIYGNNLHNCVTIATESSSKQGGLFLPCLIQLNLLPWKNKFWKFSILQVLRRHYGLKHFKTKKKSISDFQSYECLKITIEFTVEFSMSELKHCQHNNSCSFCVFFRMIVAPIHQTLLFIKIIAYNYLVQEFWDLIWR